MGWPRLQRRQWWKLLLLVGLAGPPSFIVFSNALVFLVGMWRIQEAAPAVPPREVALILGAGPGSGALQERLLAGVALWESERVGFLLVSGGGDGTAYSETAYMERFLKEHGVPADAIMVDELGLRTLDSVQRARDVFGVRRITVVTQRYHLYRALFLARVGGLDACGLAAKGGPEIDSKRVRSREFFARVQAVLDAVTGREARYPEESTLSKTF